MRELIYNGKFLTQKLTGVQRVALEVLRELAAMEDLKITVAMPCDATPPEGDFPNCEFVKVGRLKGEIWEQWSLPRYCRKRKLPLLCMGDNVAPKLYRSYVTVHDVVFKEKRKKNYGFLWGIKSRFLLSSVTKSHKVFTVSEFSKGRLEYFYPKLKKNPPVVLPLGVEHLYRTDPEPVEGITGEFYLTVGSINSNKNTAYILSLARNNPDKNFVITGKKFGNFDAFVQTNHLTNCKITGYITDGQMIWLYQHCKGFVFPSKYEGFGLPPLESVALGCRNLYLSDISVFREIYGDVAVFFDPEDRANTCKLNETHITEEKFTRLLERYTWKNTAYTIVRTIFGDN